jgi:hypothetical protein
MSASVLQSVLVLIAQRFEKRDNNTLPMMFKHPRQKAQGQETKMARANSRLGGLEKGT